MSRAQPSEDILVSVIVTCFNREHHVAKTIESIKRSDSVDRTEIVVVDDCSTDASVPAILGALRPQDRLIVHEINRGQNAAINTALQHVQGSIVAFCDSDDLYEPAFLNRTIEALHDQSLQFVYTRVVRGPTWSLAGCDKFAAVLEQGFLANLGSLVVRTAALRSIGRLGERTVPLDMCQDDRICFELSRRYCFDVVPEPLYHLQGSSNSVTRNWPAVVEGWNQLFSDYRSDIYRLCRPGTLARHRSDNLRRAVILPDKRVFMRMLWSAIRETRMARRPLVELFVLGLGATRTAGLHLRSWVASRVLKRTTR
jgi:glycosyltransferase involved in cell wall biosynthesis